jgi:hypothetical protein
MSNDTSSATGVSVSSTPTSTMSSTATSASSTTTGAASKDVMPQSFAFQILVAGIGFAGFLSI